MNKRHKIGLVIGRFQPFHKGHEYLIKKALSIAEHIIIGVGSSNICDNNNPLDLTDRMDIIILFINHEKIKNHVLKIVPLPDIQDDDKWRKNTQKVAGKFDVVIGNNNWVKRIFEKVHIPVVTINHFHRDLYEGYKIRSLIRGNQKWENRIPGYITEALKRIKSFKS